MCRASTKSDESFTTTPSGSVKTVTPNQIRPTKPTSGKTVREKNPWPPVMISARSLGRVAVDAVVAENEPLAAELDGEVEEKVVDGADCPGVGPAEALPRRLVSCCFGMKLCARKYPAMRSPITTPNAGTSFQ